MSDDKRALRVRLGLLAVIALAALTAWQGGLFDLITRDNLERFADQAGWWGPIVFVGLFAVGELLHVPSVIFVVVAGMVWPLSIALPTAYAGAMAASALVFVVGRVIVKGPLGEMIRKRLPESLLKYDDALAERGIRTVAVLRFLTFMSPLMHWVLAASKVSFRDMMIGTAVGLLPGISALVIGGDQAVAHWEAIEPYALGVVVALVVVQLARKAWSRRAARRSAAVAGPEARDLP